MKITIETDSEGIVTTEIVKDDGSATRLARLGNPLFSETELLTEAMRQATAHLKDLRGDFVR